MMTELNNIREGMKAPDFVITASNGNEISLGNFFGSPLVLFFYPKNEAPECVRLLTDFRDHFSDFKNEGARVLGISIETLDSHNKFIAKFRIPFLLLCDTNMKLCRLYGVFKPRKVAGSKVWGVERTTYLIDDKGSILKIFRNVKSPDHVPEVLECIRRNS